MISSKLCSLLNRSFTIHPKNATLWTLKGIALSRLGRDKEALPAYNTALSISPD